MRAGSKRCARGAARTKRVRVPVPAPALEVIEYLAYRAGLTVAAWMLAACIAAARAEGGDPDIGAP